MIAFPICCPQLRCSEAVGLSGAALIPAYVSLSQTYLDDKQYTQALNYLRKELHCRKGDLEQVSNVHYILPNYTHICMLCIFFG